MPVQGVIERLLFCVRILLNFTRIRRRFVLAAVGSAVTISCALYIFTRSTSSIDANFQDSDFWIVTEAPVRSHQGKYKIDGTENSDNASSFSPLCKLPQLNPFHASIQELIVDLGTLGCGRVHSSFHNNTLRVEGENIVAVNYQVISRPKGKDFESSISHPVHVRNSKKPENVSTNYLIKPGTSGCLIHTISKKCLHPFGGEAKPKDGVELVFHSDCCFSRIQFKIRTDNAIRHVSSGLCIHVDKENKVTLQPECSTKFHVKNGTLQVAGRQGLCLQSANHDKPPENDEVVKVGKDCKPFSLVKLSGESFEGLATVGADFIRVDITKAGGVDTVTEVHMQTAPKPEVLKRKVTPAGIPVNIAMVMFDSTSAANFIRKMPKSNEYLKTRPTVFMKGNTIVGDGTTAQLCAMLTGIAEEDQPEARRSKPRAKVVDGWRWVFRDFEKRGYATMYSEDSPGLGTFNFRLKGFRNPPTDHYGRPFWYEAMRHSKKGYCAGNQPIHNLTFNYFMSLFRTYPNNPIFSFLLFSDLTHGNLNALNYADADLVRVLQTMDRESHLDNTIVFIFGDHGVRFGSMRKTLQGKLEERLPHMSITFPSWFPDKYPQLYQSVQDNAKLLTTPFDIYATLQHILSYPIPPKHNQFGQSLFVPIDPGARNCSGAGVEDHWCPCMKFEKISVSRPVVKKLVDYALQFINEQLAKESKTRERCHKLSLKTIKTALTELPNEKVQKFKHSYGDHKCDSCGVILGEKDENTLAKDTVYQVQFITSPNDGFFEATVKLQGGRPSLKGSISRVDTYGHQPDCIKDTHVHLLKYCYCKQRTKSN